MPTVVKEYFLVKVNNSFCFTSYSFYSVEPKGNDSLLIFKIPCIALSHFYQPSSFSLSSYTSSVTFFVSVNVRPRTLVICGVGIHSDLLLSFLYLSVLFELFMV